MQNQIQILSRLSILFSFLLVLGCKQQQAVTDMPTSLNAFIYAYTSGEISKAASVKVRFTSNLISTEQIGAEVEDGVISFRPRIKGNAVWEDDRTIRFTPSEYLDANKAFIGTVNLEKLYKTLPRDAEKFEFSFKTKEQNFSVSFRGLQGIDPADTKNQRLSGIITTYDIADEKDVEKILKVKLSGQEPVIRWEHASKQNEHRFFIENIKRTEEDAELMVMWNGSALDVNVKDDDKFIVPGLNNFKVMSTQVIQDNEQYALIHFSDPISKSQDFKGLLTIGGYNGQLRFQVDGNQLRVYPAQRLSGERKITIETGLKNAGGIALKKRLEEMVHFEEPKPAIRLVGNGVILPNSTGLTFPFDAINLNAIDVEIFKIYNNNILQFLQTSQLDSGNDYQLNRVGNIEVQKQIKLNTLNTSGNRFGWTRYALDLSTLIEQDPNAIYQVRIGFRQEYTSYNCGTDTNTDEFQALKDPFEDQTRKQSILNYGYYGYRGYYDGFSYDHRENPCYSAYYGSHHYVSRNVVASNLGIIAKQGTDRKIMFHVTDLRTTEGVSAIDLEIYNYQQQLLKTVKTDGQGAAVIDLQEEDEPFVVIAKQGTDKGYLKLMDNNALSLSKFDVTGTKAQEGIKGFIYGERGVWRPGDSLYLNFVLEDKLDKLPENHPLIFELYDARNQLYQKFTTTDNVNGVYPLAVATKQDDGTGNWRARVQLGGATFTKNLKIETVKPNRLKINLGFGEEELSVKDMPLKSDLQVNWLHGAPARSLRSKIEMKLSAINTRFSKFRDFEFDDPARKIDSEYTALFDDPVDENGYAQVETDFRGNKFLPGKMRASFRIRAFEKGGDFSEDNFSVNYSPFESYAGISIPKNRYGRKRIDVEKGGTLQVAAVDQEGNPLGNRKLKVGVYRSVWRWWWESNRSNVSKFNSSNHFNALETATITTNTGGIADWDVKVNGWGYYLVRVCDEKSGHCSGDYFYAGYPWYGEDKNQHRKAAAMLSFSSDKQNYNVGDEVELRIPSSAGGRILVSIENGSKVLDSYWINADAEETKFKFKAEAGMAPTVYANVTLVQAHGQTKNDLPIRMYGVIPIHIKDPNTILQPEIKMAEVLKPEEKVSIEVSEGDGREMTYTLAVVDDGLLDLTRFKTPNPWDVFYAREALGVKTWDIYDQVLGASGGTIEKLLSIGGDAAAVDKGGPEKANRFKPVVKHFGPFHLKKGKKQKHEFIMPNYVGSVRTMVVASHKGAYGNAEKTTPVRKPLMVLATLPRVLGPGETLKMPVNVFAMEDKVKNVTIEVEETTGKIRFAGGNTRRLSFSRIGDKIAEFDLEVPELIGIAKFKITATGGGETATQEIEIDIRNPNPVVTDVYAEVLQPGEMWDKAFNLTGISGTNSARLEVSNIPPFNLDKRTHYLIRYPHGCVEQTTSSVFPQLYVSELMEIDDKMKREIDYNIEAGIQRLRKFQRGDGGFSYWPGSTYSNPWGSTYAGHFLLEAKNKGYDVPAIVLNKWLENQKKSARSWRQRDKYENYYYGNYAFQQAYRLYTLALAGEPELGAMNRLREQKDLNNSTRWRLAAAYALAGKGEAANQIAQNLTTDIDDYVELSYTFGSRLRDQAMILETMLELGQMKPAAVMAKTIAERLDENRWYNTQAIAYSLNAMGKFAASNKLSEELRYIYQLGNGQEIEMGTQKPISLVDMDVSKRNDNTVKVKNSSAGIIYAKLVLRGQPAVGDQTEVSRNMKLSVAYLSTNGNKIDPATIEQGTDFIAEVTVTNKDTRNYYHKEMALSQIFPSGWEIMNTRMSNVGNFQKGDQPIYQDIRDDRVYTYYGAAHGRSKVFRIQLNAAYKGRFYMPSVSAEAMYDNKVNARKPGKWVEVVEPGEI